MVSFNVGTWLDIMNMDLENAINTFCIFYINRYNENMEIEESLNG